MVRVVREDSQGHLAKHATNFQLGNAFGEPAHEGFDALFAGGVSPTQKQMRTLDSMNLPSGSIRRPVNTGHGGMLTTRQSTSLFHDLNPLAKSYMTGANSGGTQGRHDTGPGTKFSTQLSPHSENKIVYQHGAINGHLSTSRNTLHTYPQGVQSHLPPNYNKTSKHRSCSHSDVTF